MYIYYYCFLLLFSTSLGALQTPHLLHDLELQRQNYEKERLTQAFTAIDELFKKSVIKIQRLDPQQKIIKEKISTLYDFLVKPHGQEKILDLLAKNTKISPQALNFITQKRPSSLVEAIQILWQEKFIALKDANTLIANLSPMKASEAIRLVENGACLTESGYFIQLRTGQEYGEALKLSDSVDILLRRVRHENNIELPDEPILSLLDGPHGQIILSAFSSSGMSAPDAISDAHVLSEMRKYFSFLSALARITGIRPNSVGSLATINPVNSTYIMLSPQQLSAVFIGNYYLNSTNASFTHALSSTPLGIGYSGNLAWAGHGPDWWVYYTDGYLGGGFDYTVNFDQGAAWSNGYASYLSIGGSVSGWKNQLSAGITMQTLLSRGIGAGASVYLNVSHTHDVAYLDIYPIDGKFSKIRGLHQIEITDKINRGLDAALALNFSPASVPIAIAFKAGVNYTHARTYRTHTRLAEAQHMLNENDLPHLLFNAAKNIKESRIPKFENPELLIDGDELVEVKTGKLSGAFVIGLQTLSPIYAVRAGTSIDLSAEFELGLKRLPNDKFEVSIEPRRIHEMSLFASMLNIIGAGQIKSMSIARKQIFIFDFNIPEAKMAYFDLIHRGHLPGGEEIEISTEDRGPEHLLAEFRAQNLYLKKHGVQRIFLEAMDVNTAKSYAGLNAPIIPAMLFLVNKAHDAVRKNHRELNLHFEGHDREFMRSVASSVATNGIIAVRRLSSGGRVSHGQGFSGRYNKDLYVTHRRVHSIQEKPDGQTENTWAFDSLIIHAQLEDTIITDDQENLMAETVNKLFSAYIGSFEYKNSKAPRVINLERELSHRELAGLLTPEAKDRISAASQASGIDQNIIYNFLRKLKNKHSDQQGLLVKQFIEGNTGLSGFSAIHQLLGAFVEDLSISTESGYTSTVQNANTFIINYSDSIDNIIGKIGFDTHKKNKAKIKNFYREARVNLREIDQQLRLLYDDKYLIDQDSPLHKIFGKAKVEELVEKGVRQDKTLTKSALVSSRKAILELMDLQRQGFDHEERLKIYHMAKEKRLRLVEQAEIFVHKHSKLKDRQAYKRGIDLLDKINSRVSRLSRDHVMAAMDPDYVRSQLESWQNLSSELEKIIRRNPY